MNLSTERFCLRLPQHSDKDWIYTLNTDPLWMRFIGDRGVKVPDDALRFVDVVLKQHDSWGYGLLAVEDKVTGEAVGMCGLVNRDLFDYPDLGFALLPEARGKGVIDEVAPAVLNWAKAMGYTTITAMTHPQNLASQKVLLRIGYQRQGTLCLPDLGPQCLFWYVH